MFRIEDVQHDPSATYALYFMGVPQVAIVGRPNVGKSSLLNWLAGIRIAIVDDRPGVTRDRLTYLMNHDERFFELIDTGGMGHIDADKLTEHIESQITQAIDSAALILFVVDSREGVLPLDEEVAKRLRFLQTPILCLANKTDAESFDGAAETFFRLGHGRPTKISTKQNRNRSVLLNKIVEMLPPESDDEHRFAFGQDPARIDDARAVALEVIHRAVMTRFQPTLELLRVRRWGQGRETCEVEAVLAGELEEGLGLHSTDGNAVRAEANVPASRRLPRLAE